MCVYIFITLVSCFVYFGCAGSVRISPAGRVIYFLCVTPLCGVPGRYKFIWALSWSGWRDCTDFSLVWFCCSGYGTVEMVRVSSVFLIIFSLCCQLFWRAVVCGRAPFFYIDFLLGYILVLFAVSCFISC